MYGWALGVNTQWTVNFVKLLFLSDSQDDKLNNFVKIRTVDF